MGGGGGLPGAARMARARVAAAALVTHLRHALARLDPLEDLGVGNVAGHHDGARETETRADGVLRQRRPDLTGVGGGGQTRGARASGIEDPTEGANQRHPKQWRQGLRTWSMGTLRSTLTTSAERAPSVTSGRYLPGTRRQGRRRCHRARGVDEGGGRAEMPQRATLTRHSFHARALFFRPAPHNSSWLLVTPGRGGGGGGARARTTA